MSSKIFNTKRFLLPHSPRSMSCYHAKVMEDGIMKLTIHDCKHSIQLKNDLNDKNEVLEAIEKLDALANGILELKNFIVLNYMHQDSENVSFNHENTLNLQPN